jgi:hypothetical protein
MVNRKLAHRMLPLTCLCWLAAVSADEEPNLAETAVADPELLEFLGTMADEAQEWEAFLEIASDGVPPMVAEVDHEE